MPATDDFMESIAQLFAGSKTNKNNLFRDLTKNRNPDDEENEQTIENKKLIEDQPNYI